MKKLLFTVQLVLLLTSCKTNVSDFEVYSTADDTEFGFNVILKHGDTSAYYYSENGSNTLHKGTFIKYFKQNKVDTIFIIEGTSVIESHIADIKGDSGYILVDQKPLDSIFGEISYQGFAPDRPYWPNNHRLAVKQINESTKHSYWIIRTKMDEIYGPFSRHEYLIERDSLKVPKMLKLKSEIKKH